MANLSGDGGSAWEQLPTGATVVTSLSEIEKVRTQWLAAEAHPNSDFEQFVLVCRLRPEVIRPHVVMLETAGGVSLLLARLERSVVSPRIGYATPVRIPARIVHVLHEGTLGDTDSAQANAFVDHLWQLLRRGDADVVELHELTYGSPLCNAFRSRAPKLWSAQTSRWMTHWSLKIPAQPGELVNKMRPKHRNWLRRKQRELDEAFPGRVCWQWVGCFSSIRNLSSSLEAVASRTYQRALGAGFLDDEEHRCRLESFARRGMLRLQVLAIDGVARGYWLGIVYGRAFHSWATAYDPELRSFEPGNLMFHRMVDALALEGVELLDFGLGDAFYKQRFGDMSWRERTVSLFAPTVKGALLRSAVGVCGAIDAAGRQVIEASGHLDWVKTRWRERATHSAEPRPRERS